MGTFPHNAGNATRIGASGHGSADEAGRRAFFVELQGAGRGSLPRSATWSPSPARGPRRIAKAEPIVRQVASAKAGGYGPVRPTDTLWSLASKHRPSNRVSVYQTMVAIYDKNPRSFADGKHQPHSGGIPHPCRPRRPRGGPHHGCRGARRFNSDNASWKGLSPKYLASKQARTAQPVASQPAPAKPAAAPRWPLIPAAPKVTAPATEVRPARRAVPWRRTVPPSSAASIGANPLPPPGG